MKEMKRIISMVLCLVMILSLLPVGAVRVHAEDAAKPLDALVVMSDLHINTNSDHTNTKKQLVDGVLKAIKADIPNVSTVNSAGDMFSSNEGTMSGNASTVTDWVDDVFNVPVHYVWSDHDRAAADISKESRLVYGTGSGENYYVYLLSMADLSQWDRYSAGFYSKKEITDHIAAFKTTAAGLDKSKPLFIVGHQPLFDDRGDNGYAYEWVTAINEVAATMDVTYFHGHNHKYDDDQKSYYYAKGETMPVPTTKVLSGYGYSTDLESKNVELNFTHINAGYMNPETTSTSTQTNARLGTALAVVISENAIRYVTYNKNGKYTSSFAVDETVNRDHKLTSISVKAPDKVEYALSETFKAAGMEVTATYGSTKKVAVTEGYTLSEVDMNTVGKKTVTVSYQGKTATFTINVVAPAEEDPTLESIAIDSSKTYVVGDKLTVEATYSDGTTKDVSNGATFSAELSASGTYDITATYEGKTANVEDLKVYVYAEDDANLIGVQAYSEGATDLSVIWDDAAETYLNEVMDDYVVYDLALTNPGATTEYAMTLVDDMDVSKLVVYHVAEDGTLTKVDATLENDCVVFTTGLTGTFAYGVPSITINYELDSLAVSNPKKDYFVGDSLLITGDFVVTATYKAEGEKDDTRIVLPYEENNNPNGYLVNLDSFDMTTAGTYNVEITYGGKSVTFPITVWEKNFQDAPTSVSADISGAAFGVTGISVEVKEDDVITQAVKGLLEGNIAAYDIKLAGFTSGTVKVTLPIPEGVVNPAVYYVSDSGYNVIDMKAEKTEDGTGVTFTTDHFSTYVVGEGITITVPNEETVDGSDTTMTTQEKEVYVLVSSISGAGDYLISNTNSATTSAHLLTATNDGVTDTSNVTVKTGTDADGNTITYIESPNTYAIWTASANGSGYRLYNSGRQRYLQRNSSSLTVTSSSSSATSWKTTTANAVYYDGSYTDRYIRYNSGWSSLNSGSGTVYIYQKQRVNIATTTTVSGTYSIVGENMSPVAIKDAVVDLSSTLSFTANGNVTNPEMDPSKLSYVVYDADGNSANGYTGDPLGVISGIDGNTVTLSGKVGKALVKVSYDTNGDADGGVVTNYITVETTTPDHYSIQLHLNEGGTLGEEITKPVALKGIKAGDTYSVWAVVKAHASAEDTEGMDIGKLGDALSWSVSDESIAKIDTETGVITFTGTNYGTVDVTVAYEGGNGKVITDTITISVAKSQYIVPGDGTNDFPEYPNQGAVRFDKTANAVGNYSQTGIAKVELSMTGVPIKKGTDVIIMLDTSSSMNSNKVTGTNKTRLTVLQESLAKLIAQLQTKDADGNFMDIKVAIADFNGYYGDGVTKAGAQSGTPYDRTAGDYVKNGNQNGSGYDQPSEAQVYTGSKALNAGAFVPVGQLPTSYKLNYVSGTNYDYAFDAIYQLGTAIKASNTENRELIVVFMSDGASLQWNYFGTENGYTKWNSWITGTWKADDLTTSNLNSTTHSYFYDLTDHDGDGQLNEHRMANAIKGDPSKPYEVIRKTTAGLPEGTLVSAGKDYLYTVPGLGATMYTINFDAKQDGQITVASIDKALSSTASDKTGTTQYYYKVTSADQLDAAFKTIGHAITYAATNVKVEDKIGNDYTLTFKLPTGVTNTEAGMEEFYIQVLEYQLDADKERTGTPAVLENFTFEHNGTIKTHTVNGVVTCEGTACNHVTFNPSRVTGINGTHFTYTCAPKLDANGNDVKNEVGDTITEEYLTWNADKLTTTELVLEYFAYLDNSAGFEPEDQVPAGTYYTNEYATLTYKNYQGNEVQQEFPIPQMTWNGAQVTYVFYLVNDAGQPVNRAGRVIPFAESVYVTDPVTFNVTWNEQTGSENILAHDIFAEVGVPEVYELYDDSAQYVIRVYQTENVDKNGVNGNYFQISGDANKQIDSALDKDTDKNNSTTVVFNTKTGVKYDKYGIYSIYEAGTSLTNGTANINTTVKADDIDYANTTVAFAVVWKPELKEDTVVIDYGLDVVIDVIKNDNMAAGVVGVRTVAPKSGSEDVKINSGSFTSAKEQTVDVYIDTNNDTDGLKELKIGTAKVENMNQVRFSLNKDNGMQFTDPAVFYYEADVNFYDSNNVLQTTSMYSSVTVIPATTVYYEDDFLTLTSFSKSGDIWSQDETAKWTASAQNGVQDQDRPGESKISEALDADNVYGYDSTYETMSTYSLNNSAHITVDAATRGEATFTFYGTGFDVISTTSNTTGTLIVQVFNGDGNVVRSTIVDTFYGMDKQGNVSVNNPEAIYQVPVIKVFDLDYGQYTVKITAGYNEFFDHINGSTDYDLYLDAIRIYDPTGNQDDTANGAYLADDEAWPTYQELRNNIIAASNYDVTENEDGTVTVTGTDLSGAIFIDCNDATTSIADYVSFGPNNELYLANNQAIAFTVSDNNIADIQLGIKVANGGSVTYEINGEQKTLNTATDMYYSILDYAKDGQVVTIKNLSGGILSLTNIKVTHTEAPANESGISLLSMDGESAGVALMMLRRAPVIEEEVPETIVPEETEPEITVPEVSEPETEPEVTEPAKPDNTELKAAVEESKKLKEKDYTKESFKALDKAIKSAEKVLKDRKATQAEIDEALADLNEAVEALEANTPAAKPGKDEKPNQNKPGKEEKPEKDTKPDKDEKPADDKPGKPGNNNQNKPANNKGHAAAVEQAQKVADTVGAIAEALFGWLFR